MDGFQPTLRHLSHIGLALCFYSTSAPLDDFRGSLLRVPPWRGSSAPPLRDGLAISIDVDRS